MESIPDLWSWANGTLLPALYSFDKSSDLVIGTVEVRQVRVVPVDCGFRADLFADPSSVLCYPIFDFAHESRDPFGVNAQYTWSERDSTLWRCEACPASAMLRLPFPLPCVATERWRFGALAVVPVSFAVTACPIVVVPGRWSSRRDC